MGSWDALGQGAIHGSDALSRGIAEGLGALGQSNMLVALKGLEQRRLNDAVARQERAGKYERQKDILSALGFPQFATSGVSAGGGAPAGAGGMTAPMSPQPGDLSEYNTKFGKQWKAATPDYSGVAGIYKLFPALSQAAIEGAGDYDLKAFSEARSAMQAAATQTAQQTAGARRANALTGIEILSAIRDRNPNMTEGEWKAEQQKVARLLDVSPDDLFEFDATGRLKLEQAGQLNKARIAQAYAAANKARAETPDNTPEDWMLANRDKFRDGAALARAAASKFPKYFNGVVPDELVAAASDMYGKPQELRAKIEGQKEIAQGSQDFKAQQAEQAGQRALERTIVGGAVRSPLFTPEELPATTARAALLSQHGDVVQRVLVLREQGVPDDDLAQALIQKGIDPQTFFVAFPAESR